MNKISIMVLVLLMATSISFAAGNISSSSTNGNWVIQTAGDMVIPTGIDSGSYSLGFGGEALVGYAFDQNFSLGVLSGYQSWSNALKASGISAGYIPIEAVAKYEIGTDNDKVKPYGVFGAGVAINDISGSYAFGGTFSSSTANFLLDPGIGVAFVLSPKTELFIQSKVSVDFADYFTHVYIPIQLGLNFGL